MPTEPTMTSANECTDQRLIEDYLPIEEIGAEASREKSVSSGNIATLHPWWARRPVVACRAAIYGTLMPGLRARADADAETERAAVADFVRRLCKFPGSRDVIEEARTRILSAHAERLSREVRHTVDIDDIVAGRAARPKVLDMFAGGGAIPLEALRLGCDAYALELNPVAHIVELCTLAYPQKYGRPDSGERGSEPDGTWGGLIVEVRFWARWVRDRIWTEVGDLYPPIEVPLAAETKDAAGRTQLAMPGKVFDDASQKPLSTDFSVATLNPIAYLWTRTIRCKNPGCGGTVPLVRQTWLSKRPRRYAALRISAHHEEQRVRFEVVEAADENGLGFNPGEFSKGGNASCPFCGTVADKQWVKDEALAGRMGQQMMAAVCTSGQQSGRIYVSADDLRGAVPPDSLLVERLAELRVQADVSAPDEPISSDPAKGATFCTLYGLTTFAGLFSVRHMLALTSLVQAIRLAESHMRERGYDGERMKAVVTYLAMYLDRAADRWSSLCRWNTVGEKIEPTFSRQALPMVWDFAEANPFGGSGGDWNSIAENAEHGMSAAISSGSMEAHVERGDATRLPWADATFDAIVTDPPYYDNVPYANLADFFYVWLKRSVGHLYPEHFAGDATPKKSEIVADASRNGGDASRATEFYEAMMRRSFQEACRVLKPGGPLVVVYAHKTTLGWSTLVEALRRASFTVTEVGPFNCRRICRAGRGRRLVDRPGGDRRRRCWWPRRHAAARWRCCAAPPSPVECCRGAPESGPRRR